MPNESAKIILSATHGKLTKVRDVLAVEGTINALKVSFQFATSDWDDTTKTAVFVRGRVTPSTINENPICIVLDENNECNIPSEILAKEGMFSVGVFGVKDNYRIVSNWICYRIDNGCYADGSIPIDPTSTIYEQIISMINNKSEVGHKHDERYYTKDESNEKFLTEEDLPNQKQSDWNQNDSNSVDYIKNRPFYDEVISTDISGAIYIISGFTTETVTVTHETIPFELGQQWIVETNTGNKRGPLPVQENENGELYVGSPGVSEQPFYIKSTETTLNYNFMIQMGVSILTLTCTSGTITTTEPKKIDSKYLPGIQIHEINKDGSMSNQDFLNLDNGYYYMYNCPLLSFDCVVRVLDGAWAIYDAGKVYGGLYLNDSGNINYRMDISLDGFGLDDFTRIFPQDINEGQTLIAARDESSMVYKPVDFPLVPTKLSELENDLNVVVHINVGNNITSDMTYSEIMEAYRAGKNVTAQVRYLAGGGFLAELTNTINYLEFTASTGQSIQISTDNSIYVNSHCYVVSSEMEDVLRYTDQTLTDKQKLQVRENIGAITSDYVDAIKPKLATIILLAADWVGDTAPYSQVVTIDGVTANSKIDLQPTVEQIVDLQDSDITLTISNNNGSVVAYALNYKPTKDYEMQVLITEVSST